MSYELKTNICCYSSRKYNFKKNCHFLTNLRTFQTVNTHIGQWVVDGGENLPLFGTSAFNWWKQLLTAVHAHVRHHVPTMHSNEMWRNFNYYFTRPAPLQQQHWWKSCFGLCTGAHRAPGLSIIRYQGVLIEKKFCGNQLPWKALPVDGHRWNDTNGLSYWANCRCAFGSA